MPIITCGIRVGRTMEQKSEFALALAVPLGVAVGRRRGAT